MSHVIKDSRDNSRDMTLPYWPSPQDYNEAVQVAAQSFPDPTFAIGQAELDKHGIPRPITGMFASVYKIKAADGMWALRCFLHNVPDQIERYTAISLCLQKLRHPAFVEFDFQERGAHIRGREFPILKMRWCDGDNLAVWIEKNLTQTELLERLLHDWAKLISDFRYCGIAHGDLQHGNILIENGHLRLVDYDGMYVPALSAFASNELGHRNYQHPLRNARHFGAGLDNFSAWLIYLSIKMVRHDPGLWWELHGGDDCLLFRSKDFDAPLDSDLFIVLENHPSDEIRQSSRTLRYLLSLPVEQIPPLGAPITIPDSLPEMGADESGYDPNADDDGYGDPGYGNEVNYGARRKRSKRKGGSSGGRPVNLRTESVPELAPLKDPNLVKSKSASIEDVVQKLAVSAQMSAAHQQFVAQRDVFPVQDAENEPIPVPPSPSWFPPSASTTPGPGKKSFLDNEWNVAVLSILIFFAIGIYVLVTFSRSTIAVQGEKKIDLDQRCQLIQPSEWSKAPRPSKN